MRDGTWTKEEYAELYKDLRWKKRALEIMERDGNQCTRRGRTCKGYLQVHHLYYISGNFPWNHPDDALTTLCRRHHAQLNPNAKQIVTPMQSTGKISPLRWKTGAEWEAFNVKIGGQYAGKL